MATAAVPATGNEFRHAKTTTKPYRFVTTMEEARTPLQLEIDCDSDRDATLIALDMACDLTSVEVWSDRAMIYRVPSIREAMRASGLV